MSRRYTLLQEIHAAVEAERPSDEVVLGYVPHYDSSKERNLKVFVMLGTGATVDFETRTTGDDMTPVIIGVIKGVSPDKHEVPDLLEIMEDFEKLVFRTITSGGYVRDSIETDPLFDAEKLAENLFVGRMQINFRKSVVLT